MKKNWTQNSGCTLRNSSRLHPVSRNAAPEQLPEVLKKCIYNMKKKSTCIDPITNVRNIAHVLRSEIFVSKINWGFEYRLFLRDPTYFVIMSPECTKASHGQNNYYQTNWIAFLEPKREKFNSLRNSVAQLEIQFRTEWRILKRDFRTSCRRNTTRSLLTISWK